MSFRSAPELLKSSFAYYVGIFRNKNLYEVYAFFFFVITLLVSYVALDQVSSLDDHFFHIRFAQTIFEEGLSAFTNFQSIAFSEVISEGEHLIYYNFLFYLALIPFSFFSPLVFGIKLFGVLAVSFSLTALYALLRRLPVNQPFLWTFAFFIILVESGIIVRFFSARPFTLAPILIILFLYLLHSQRFRSAAAIAFIYFYWHTGTFFLPLIVAVAYFVIRRFYAVEEEPRWQAIFLPLIGTILAVGSSYLIYPGVLAYVKDVTLPLLFDAALPGGAGVAEGIEVYGVAFKDLFGAFAPVIALLILVGSMELSSIFQRVKNTPHLQALSNRVLRITLFVGSLTLLFASFLSLRFADYFLFFSIPYIALAVSDRMSESGLSRLSPPKALKTGIAVVLLLFLINTPFEIQSQLESIPTHLTADPPAQWMMQNLETNEVIFNVDWDAFPLFYYYTGDRFRFVTGLEPRFLYEYDERLYWIWRHIGDHGQYCESAECPFDGQNQNVKQQFSLEDGERIADTIVNEFKSQVILVRSDRKPLIELMDHSPRFEKKYSDPEKSLYLIYRVVPGLR